MQALFCGLIIYTVRFRVISIKDAEASRLTEAHEPRSFNARNALLRGAANVFSEHGLKGSTVRQIAAEAGVNNTLITYHFGTKEKLWIEVVSWLLDEERKAGDRSFDPSGDLACAVSPALENSFYVYTNAGSVGEDPVQGTFVRGRTDGQG